MSFDLDFAYALGKPQRRAGFRNRNSDFIVDEALGFEPCGEGEHLYVQIRKDGENTAWVADKLAQFFQVKPMDVGFSGQKDRHALTTQWFSVYLPGKPTEVDWAAFVAQSQANISVLAAARHSQKLRRGMHQANHFVIGLRDLAFDGALENRLLDIQQHGVPNYFGEQRFGREGNNLSLAQAWVASGRKLKNRNKQGMVMSAARAYLFNCILSERVREGCWRTLLAGDVAECDLPTAPLWGRGVSASGDAAQQLEQRVLAGFGPWCDRLEHCGLNQERRALVLRPSGLHWQVEGEVLRLSFILPAGQFATSVLRELCLLDDQSNRCVIVSPQ